MRQVLIFECQVQISKENYGIPDPILDINRHAGRNDVFTSGGDCDNSGGSPVVL